MEMAVKNKLDEKKGERLRRRATGGGIINLDIQHGGGQIS